MSKSKELIETIAFGEPGAKAQQERILDSLQPIVVIRYVVKNYNIKTILCEIAKVVKQEGR